jgi:hypothetical protein
LVEEPTLDLPVTLAHQRQTFVCGRGEHG